MRYKITYRDEDSKWMGDHTITGEGTVKDCEDIIGGLIHNGCWAVELETEE